MRELKYQSMVSFFIFLTSLGFLHWWLLSGLLLLWLHTLPGGSSKIRVTLPWSMLSNSSLSAGGKKLRRTSYGQRIRFTNSIKLHCIVIILVDYVCHVQKQYMFRGKPAVECYHWKRFTIGDLHVNYMCYLFPNSRSIHSTPISGREIFKCILLLSSSR
jgi:hypothetical protein